MARQHRRRQTRSAPRPGRTPTAPRTPQEAAGDPRALIQLAHGRLRARNRDYQDTAQFQPTPEGQLAGDLSKCPIDDIAGLADFPFVAIDLASTRVRDLSALASMPLRELFLEDTPLDDLSPLSGLALTKLYLSHAPISDLSPLRGIPLKELNLVSTQVTDLSHLADSPLQTIWLNGCPISDLSPLTSCPLVSVSIEQCPVTDLSPLRSVDSLERLALAGAAATDLTPLADLKLKRLIFSPDKIEAGLDALRAMDTLEEIGPDLDHRQSPDAFWAKHDAPHTDG